MCTAAWTAIAPEMLGCWIVKGLQAKAVPWQVLVLVCFRILHRFALSRKFNHIWVIWALSVSDSHTLAEVAASFPSWDSSSSWGSCPWETSSWRGPQTSICHLHTFCYQLARPSTAKHLWKCCSNFKRGTCPSCPLAAPLADPLVGTLAGPWVGSLAFRNSALTMACSFPCQAPRS